MSIHRFALLALLTGAFALSGCIVDSGVDDTSPPHDEVSYGLLELEENGDDDVETQTEGRHRDSDDEQDDDVLDKPDQKMDPVPDPWEGGNDGNKD